MFKRKILPATIAAIFATGVVATGVSPAFAMGHVDATKAAGKTQIEKTTPDKNKNTKKKDDKDKIAENDLVKVSQDALISLRDLRSARFAIFNGEPDRAQTYVDAARTRIDVANSEAKKYALDIKAPKKEDLYVPFDSSLTVLDTYEPNDKKAKGIAKANKHLSKGEQKEALDTLKLADVDVAVSTGLLPVKFARENIDKASDLVRQGKYYQANLALKEVDDAVIIHTFDVDNVPKVKDSGKDKKAG